MGAPPARRLGSGFHQEKRDESSFQILFRGRGFILFCDLSRGAGADIYIADEFQRPTGLTCALSECCPGLKSTRSRAGPTIRSAITLPPCSTFFDCVPGLYFASFGAVAA